MDSLFHSGVLGLAAVAVALILLSVAQALELRQRKGVHVRLISIIAAVMCVIVAVLLVGRVAVLGG